MSTLAVSRVNAEKVRQFHARWYAPEAIAARRDAAIKQQAARCDAARKELRATYLAMEYSAEAHRVTVAELKAAHAWGQRKLESRAAVLRDEINGGCAYTFGDDFLQ